MLQLVSAGFNRNVKCVKVVLDAAEITDESSFKQRKRNENRTIYPS